MARCGCSGSSCSCVIRGSGGVSVSGSGTVNSPYVVSSALNLTIIDSATIDLALAGDGSLTEPYILSANANVALDDLTDVDTSGGTTGQVLARQSDGSYALVPPSTASPGAINTGNGLTGDGSSGSPLNVRVAPGGGLSIATQGLQVTGSGAWSNYSPTLRSSSTGNITLDSGSSLVGRYKRDGDTVHVNIELILSANFPAPSGRYSITLPVQDRQGMTMRQIIPMLGFFTDDGTDPIANEWKAWRKGNGSLEGNGRIERIYVDRGGYATPVGTSYPKWRAYPVRMYFSGSYEAD